MTSPSALTWKLLKFSFIACVRNSSKGAGSHRPARYSTEGDESEDDRDVKRVEDLDQGEGNNLEVERWVLEVTHSVASSYATEMLLSAHDGDMGRVESSEKRLRSVVLISS